VVGRHLSAADSITLMHLEPTGQGKTIMKRTNPTRMLTAAIAAGALLAGAGRLGAVPVVGVYVEDPRCDVIPQQTLPHELGDAGFFPINEAFTVVVNPTTTVVCVPDDLIPNDWEVEIRNVSGLSWNNLFFVADPGMTVGNSDGSVFDAVNAPAVITDAFRIDGTVTGGVNKNLISESINANEIFEPGELWTFYVTNFANSIGTAPPPTFQTPGVFAGSSPVGSSNTASILATPVIPEPKTVVSLIGLGAGLLMRRRHRYA
jgi:hypothetical protein